MEDKNNINEYLNKLLKEGIEFSDQSFVLIDIPEDLENFFFLNFFQADTEDQNKLNLNFWKLSLVPVYINICIYFSKQNDLKDFLEKSLEGDFRSIDIESIFPDYGLDFLQVNPSINRVLSSYHTKCAVYSDNLLYFLKLNLQNGKLTYQTSLGLWYLYNIIKTQPSYEEVQIAPVLGSFITTSIQMKKVFKQ